MVNNKGEIKIERIKVDSILTRDIRAIVKMLPTYNTLFEVMFTMILFFVGFVVMAYLLFSRFNILKLLFLIVFLVYWIEKCGNIFFAQRSKNETTV